MFLFMLKFPPKVFLTEKKLACQRKSVYNSKRGVRPILTNVFLEQMRNNMENLSNKKVFKVTKGCLKNLARAKNEMCARKNKSRFLEQLILPPLNFFVCHSNTKPSMQRAPK